MPPRTHVLGEAARYLVWLRIDVGRELRLARHTSGATMQQVSDRLGWSKSKISRIERGLSPRVSLEDVTRCGAVVGLRPSVKLFPTARALRDIGQIELLASLNARMHPSWHSRQEVTMPREGDLRAADQLSTIPGCRLMVEAIRRFTDSQAQTRGARAKQRDLSADRLLLLVEDTRANRLALGAAGSELLRTFPISQRAMLAALGSGRAPMGDGIVLLRRRRGVAPHATKGERRAVPASAVSPDATAVA